MRYELEVLERARRRIAEEGWMQGDYYPGAGDGAPPQGPYCLEGAIALGGFQHMTDTDERVWSLLSDSLPDSSSLAEWNDEPLRMKREVLALLDCTIAQVRAGLDGPSREIIVEPVEAPAKPEPATIPEPSEAPVEDPDRELIPA